MREHPYPTTALKSRCILATSFASLLLILVAGVQAASPNPTVRENERPGAPDWRLETIRLDRGTGLGVRSPRIEGYASKPSLYPGEAIAFHISAAPAATIDLDIYRTGYYDGAGARHMTRMEGLRVKPQAVPEPGTDGLHECDWPAATTLTIPDDWASGVYLAKMTRRDDGTQSYAIFIVKSRQPADILFQCSDLTWQSYNKWPGNASLYDNDAERTDPYNEYMYTGEKARISFDRPYGLFIQLQFVAGSIGSGEYLFWEYPLAYWLEKEGYHVAYCSNLDPDRDPAVLQRSKVFLSVGHDEYWTDPALANVYAARGRGMSMAFLGGNSILHIVRMLDSSVTGEPARAFYREQRRRPAAQEFMGASTYGVGYSDWVVTTPDHWIFEDTGLRNGDAIRNLVGWEFHGTPVGATPGLVTVASAPVIRGSGELSDRAKHAATIYPGPRNNWVFNAGTIWWAQALANPPGHVPAATFQSHGPDVDERVQRITANFLQRSLADSTIDLAAGTDGFHERNGVLNSIPDTSAMVRIPPGRFTMGSPEGEPGRRETETPHEVILTRSFAIGRTEIHWSLWDDMRTWAVDHGYPDIGPGFNGKPVRDPGEEDHPVIGVSWWDAIKWCNARSEREGRTPVYYGKRDFAPKSVIREAMVSAVYANHEADGYRLPTEAEWEYACRAGVPTAFYTGPIINPHDPCTADPNADSAAWYCENAERSTYPAGGKIANSWGLWDMHGNVAEWCWDWYGPYETGDAVADPTGPETGVRRVLRGGSMLDPPRKLRTAHRHAVAPATGFYNIGFRVARTVVE